MSLRRAILALLAALLALALPATASAEINIDSVADEPDAVAGGVCETAAGDCTLRAAIEVANLAGTAQDVFFADPFNGQPADTIALTSPLPAIEAPVSLIAGGCGPGPKPCAGVSGPAGNVGISVEADGVTIRNLSITGALTGINVIDESQDFIALGNWIGVKLDGSAGPNETGIFIGPGSDRATIGGSLPFQRNVIAGNDDEGLDIQGASEAVIRGNYLGVAPDGATPMANARNIDITDSTAGGGFAAEDNEIGSTIEGAPLISEACDGGCNVISGATSRGIDLDASEASEAPASGPTTVHGNYIGLDAAGSVAVANGHGIGAGGADQLTVGGLAPTEKNYLAGGELGISGDGENLEVLGNTIGIAPDGSDLTAPSNAGVFVGAASVSEGASIEDNEIRMGGGVGIDAWFAVGSIVGNHLEGGSSGIRTFAGPGGGLIAGNEIESTTDYGILIESPDNEVRANTIADSAGAGLRVVNPPGIVLNGNLIGGDTAESENAIEGSHDAAIEIFEEATEPGSTTEIARNRGSDNGGLFIDLVAGANEGILPPAFSAAIQSQAAGTAEPGATVRVFRKASAEPGELQSFLAEAVADGSGKWSVTYPQVPTGTIVAATQTGETGGTSELSTATATADPSNGGGGGKAGGGGGGVIVCKPSIKHPCPGGPDRTAPQTNILKGPKGKVETATVKFKFSSSEKRSTFRCKLDGKPYRVCKSPKTYKNLKPGKHVFKVRAVDKAGNIDPSAAKRKFTVLGS
jgi:hypothetical protein